MLDFVAAMEKCSVRDAALKLEEWFTITEPATPRQWPEDQPESRGGGEPVSNKPLNFQLKDVDPGASIYIGARHHKRDGGNIRRRLFSGRGSMHGRIVIPIHNERGELVAYAGRSIDGSEPRYKLPAGFHKSVELFNLHRAIGECGRAAGSRGGRIL